MSETNLELTTRQKNLIKYINELEKEFSTYPVKFGFLGLGGIVNHRTYAWELDDKGNKEQFYQEVARCLRSAIRIGVDYSKAELKKMYLYQLNLAGFYAGRDYWQCESKLFNKGFMDSLINCWAFTMDTINSFVQIFDELSLGGGTGYSIERKYTEKLPEIKPCSVTIDNTLSKEEIIKKFPELNTEFGGLVSHEGKTLLFVGDSREGWVNSYKTLLESFFLTGQPLVMNTQLVRKKGEKIAGFGGTASGDEEFVISFSEIIKIFNAASGRKLKPLEVSDINCLIANLVIAGNSRRSALLCLCDPDDKEVLLCKRWDLGNIPSYRARANFSVNTNDVKALSQEFWDTYEKGGEPFGLVNIAMAKKGGRLGKNLQKDLDRYYKRELADPDVAVPNPCSPGFSTILTPEGVRTFDDINIGSIIWSGQRWTKIINKVMTGTKPVYKYHTTAGSFIGTENHRILSKGEKIEVGFAENIDTCQGEFCPTEPIDPQDVLDGLVLGDGVSRKAANNSIVLCVGEKDTCYFDDDSEIKHLFIKEKSVNESNWEVKTTIKSLDYTYNREIPEEFMRASLNKVRGFLRGLYSANGSLVGNRITLKQSSFKLIEQVQILLSALGIRTYYTTNKSKPVVFRNGTYQCKESYDLNISDFDSRVKFKELIGFLHPYKNEKLEVYTTKSDSKFSHPRIKNNYSIISTEYLGDLPVYDITVDAPEHNYWTGGLLVSNCSEIMLASGANCLLAEAYMPNIKTYKEFVEILKLLYKFKKHVTQNKYLYKTSEDLAKSLARMGIGVSGILMALEKTSWYEPAYEALRKFDKKYSAKHGFPESIKLTCVKPSGSLSLLAGVTPGVHPSFSKYYYRTFEISANNPLLKLCENSGFRIEDKMYRINDAGDIHYESNTKVVYFPCKTPEGVICAEDMSPIEQLEIVKMMQEKWADNSISVTVYYTDENLEEIKKYLEENFATSFKSLSFCKHSNHTFLQAPYQAITEEEYNEAVKKITPITSFKNLIDTDEDLFNDCVGGLCPVR